jgi:hypothetical protein
MTEWKALVGRIILFPTAPSASPSTEALELYKRVWGTNPESYQKQQNAFVPTVAQGKTHGVAITCGTHPTRIEFGLMPAVSNADALSLELFENSGNFYAELKRIIEAVGNGAVTTAVSRVALQIQFLSVKPSQTEANKTLASIMPEQYSLQLTDEHEFILQANRPRTSHEVKTVEMNFITKWSVDRLQVLRLSIPMTGGPIAMPIDLNSSKIRPLEFIAASVMFDFNNAPRNDALTVTDQASLLLESLNTVVQYQLDMGLNVEGFKDANSA